MFFLQIIPGKKKKAMPRVPYRAFTMYEEAMGLTGSQKMGRILLAVNGFCLFTSIGIWGMCSASRHQDEMPIELETKGNDWIRERNDVLLQSVYANEQKNRAMVQTRGKYASWGQ